MGFPKKKNPPSIQKEASLLCPFQVSKDMWVCWNEIFIALHYENHSLYVLRTIYTMVKIISAVRWMLLNPKIGKRMKNMLVKQGFNFIC